MANEKISYKGMLLNYCAKNKKNQPVFICDSDGPPHDPRFITKALIDGILVGEGEGKSKKEAEQRASKAALRALGYEETANQTNFEGHLNELCQKKKWTFNFLDGDRTGPSHNLEFTCKAEVNGKMFPETSRKKTKKLAKKEAAYLALRELKRVFPDDIPELPDVFIDESGSENCSLSGSLDRSTSENEPVQPAASPPKVITNYDSLLNELCQKKRWPIVFVDGARTGPSHNSEFTCKAKVNEKMFPESSRKKTKKLAKKEAAYLALRELRQEFPNDIPALPDVYVDESINQSNIGQNRTSTENGLAHLPSEDGFKIPFRDSCSPHSNKQRQYVENGLERLYLTDSKATSSLSSSSSNVGEMLKLLYTHREFDDITELDSGSFGTVIKARKTLVGLYYAVKIVPVKSRDINKYLEEVKVLARLEHPNIVRYYNAWLDVPGSSDSSSTSDQDSKTERYLFNQMELCENGSLKKWIEERNEKKIINKHQSLDYFRQIIEAVKYIHSKELIHRDLKPANIFFTKDMVVKIGDFGLVAHMTREDESEARQRTQGTGTPSYMAPEQRSMNTYEIEVDIYALGLILVELLWIFGTGHERANEWRNIREGRLPPVFVQRYPAEDAEIKKMLSQDRKKRPTAEQLKKFFETNEILDTRTL